MLRGSYFWKMNSEESVLYFVVFCLGILLQYNRMQSKPKEIICNSNRHFTGHSFPTGITISPDQTFTKTILKFILIFLFWDTLYINYLVCMYYPVHKLFSVYVLLWVLSLCPVCWQGWIFWLCIQWVPDIYQYLETLTPHTTVA